MVWIPPSRLGRALVVYGLCGVALAVVQAAAFAAYSLLPMYAYFSRYAVLAVVGPIGLLCAVWYYPSILLATAASILAVALHSMVVVAHADGPRPVELLWPSEPIALLAYVVLTTLAILCMRPFRRVITGRDERCLVCGYVRRGWGSSRCPECGAESPATSAE